ncbi:hypothetical protein K3495_g8387 [Podosphaera aphanis]|nr:hypothetical protein K3495_g8387 [Podosphaera aphanis]
MDLFQELAAHLIQLYYAAEPYLSSIHRSLAAFYSRAEPLLLPHFNALAQWAYASPSILIVGLFILILFILLQTINFIRRVLAFWMRLLVKLTFWGAVVALIAVLWQRGVWRTLGELEAWCTEVAAVYWREYKRWENYGTDYNKKGRAANFGVTPGRRGANNPRHGW